MAQNSAVKKAGSPMVFWKILLVFQHFQQRLVQYRCGVYKHQMRTCIFAPVYQHQTHTRVMLYTSTKRTRVLCCIPAPNAHARYSAYKHQTHTGVLALVYKHPTRARAFWRLYTSNKHARAFLRKCENAKTQTFTLQNRLRVLAFLGHKNLHFPWFSRRCAAPFSIFFWRACGAPFFPFTS